MMYDPLDDPDSSCMTCGESYKYPDCPDQPWCPWNLTSKQTNTGDKDDV